MTSTYGGSTSNDVSGTVRGNIVQGGVIGSVVMNQFGGSRRRAGSVPVDDRLAGLRAKVAAQWRHEVGVRGLHQPRPVRLRWRSTSRPVEVSSPREPLRGALGHDVTDRLPVAHELVDAFGTDSRQQLVVLGAPGAGKTTLAILYTLAVAENKDHPVPILLSIAGWRPWDPNDAIGEPIETWVTRRIADDHPELAVDADVLRQLWAGKRLLPVLDGLDEMPQPLLAHALADLDRSAGAGLDMVLTCRTAEYEGGCAAGNVLAHAAVVDIEPVAVDDAAVYLTQRETAHSRRWNGVVELMRREPDGPVATALSTPLMISLVRQIYRDPASDPTEVTRFATSDAIGQHLLAHFLPSVYPRERERVRSTRWLSFLAHHLRDRVADPNYEWWRLHRSVPAAVIAIMIIVFATVLGAVLTPTVAVILGTSKGFGELVLPGSIIGVVVGVVAAPRSIPTATAGGRTSGPGLPRTIVTGVVRDIRILLTAASAIGVAALTVGYLFARLPTIGAVFGVVGWVRELWSPDSDTSIPALLIVFIVLGVITVTNGLSALNGGLPQRSTPRLRLLAPSVAVGLAIGMAVAFPFVPLGLLTPLGLGDGFGAWSLVAGSVGVPIGLTRWLAAPAEHQASSSPQNLLRWDRRALLVTVTATALVGALTTGLASLTFPAKDQPPILPISLIVGVVIGGVVLIGSGTSWLTYTLARLWLALIGRLPLRLNRFLRNAHAAGVLRQTGPAYQLRHDLLNDHLADLWRPRPVATGSNTTRHRARRRRTWPSLLVLATSLVALAGSIPAIYLDNAPHVLDGQVKDAWGMVLSLDGRTLAAVDPSSRPPIVRVWDVPSGHLKRTLRPSPRVAAVAAIVLNGDGSELTLLTRSIVARPDAKAAFTTAVWRWQTEQGRPMLPLPGAASQLNDPAEVGATFSPDGNAIAIARTDGTVQLWDLTADHAAGQRIGPVGPATIAIGSLAYSIDGRLLAVLVDDGSVAVVDLATRRVTRTLPAGTIRLALHRLQFNVSTNGSTVAAVDDNGTAQMWSLDSGLLIKETGTGAANHRSVTLSSNGSTLASTSADGTIELRDLATDTVTGTLEPIEDESDAYSQMPVSLVFAPDGRSLAATTLGDSLRVWDTPTAT